MVTSSEVYLVDDRRKSHHYYFDYRVSVSKWRTAFLGQPLGCTCTRLKPLMSYSSPLDWKSRIVVLQGHVALRIFSHIQTNTHHDSFWCCLVWHGLQWWSPDLAVEGICMPIWPPCSILIWMVQSLCPKLKISLGPVLFACPGCRWASHCCIIYILYFSGTIYLQGLVPDTMGCCGDGGMQ